jgi:hypothetical protein
VNTPEDPDVVLEKIDQVSEAIKNAIAEHNMAKAITGRPTIVKQKVR